MSYSCIVALGATALNTDIQTPGQRFMLDLIPQQQERQGRKTIRGSLTLPAPVESQVVLLTETTYIVDCDQYSWTGEVKVAATFSVRYSGFLLREYEWYPPIPFLAPLLSTIFVSVSFHLVIFIKSLGKTCHCISQVNQKNTVTVSHHRPWASTKWGQGYLPLLEVEPGLQKPGCRWHSPGPPGTQE